MILTKFFSQPFIVTVLGGYQVTLSDVPRSNKPPEYGDVLVPALTMTITARAPSARAEALVTPPTLDVGIVPIAPSARPDTAPVYPPAMEVEFDLPVPSAQSLQPDLQTVFVPRLAVQIIPLAPTVELPDAQVQPPILEIKAVAIQPRARAIEMQLKAPAVSVSFQIPTPSAKSVVAEGQIDFTYPERYAFLVPLGMLVQPRGLPTVYPPAMIVELKPIAPVASQLSTNLDFTDQNKTGGLVLLNMLTQPVALGTDDSLDFTSQNKTGALTILNALVAE